VTSRRFDGGPLVHMFLSEGSKVRKQPLLHH